MLLQKKDYYLWAIMSGFYLPCLLVISNSFLNDLVLIPVIYRKINIPVAAWTLITLYGVVIYYWKKSKTDTTPFVFQLVFWGWAAHQFLMYMQLFNTVYGSNLGRMYVIYIEILFMFLSFLISSWGLHIIKNLQASPSNPFYKIYFLPIIFLPFFSSIYFFYKNYTAMAIMALLSIGLSFLASKKDILAKAGELLKKIHSDKRKVLLIIFFIAFAFRFAFSVNVILKTEYANPRVDFTFSSDDGTTYDAQGRLLAEDFGVLFRDSIITPKHFEPGYGIFLSVIYKIIGHNYFIVGFIQAILGGLLVVICFHIADRFFGLKTALISSYLLALNQPLIFIAGTLNVESTYIFLVILSLYLIIIAHDCSKYNNWALFVGGLILGLAVITRGVIVLFPIFIFIWMFGRSLRKKEKVLKAFGSFGLFSLGLLIVLISMCYVNYLNSGKFILTDKGNAYASATSTLDKELSPGNHLFREGGFDFTKPVELTKQIASKPLLFFETYLKVVPVRLKNFFFWHPFGAFDPITLYNEMHNYKATLEFYGVVFALIGTALILSRLTIDKFLVFSFVCYYSLLHSSFGYVQTVRYRTPVIPFILIIMSFGISWFFNKMTAKEKLSD